MIDSLDGCSPDRCDWCTTKYRPRNTKTQAGNIGYDNDFPRVLALKRGYVMPEQYLVWVLLFVYGFIGFVVTRAPVLKVLEVPVQATQTQEL